MPKKSVTFETSLVRLDEIVKTLEKGDVPLEESIRLFEEGTKLAAKCTELLSTAELKVATLMQDAQGMPVEQEQTDED